MKNDLSTFEKNLLRTLNFQESKRYNYKNFMEWNSSEEEIKKNLQEGEIMYKVLNYYVAIKP